MGTVTVIGGGAAGLFAAITAGREGKKVVLLEKNEKLGKKIYITGKGRCNLTNDCDPLEYVKNVATNPKFTYGAINALSPKDLMEFFESASLKLKTERGRRVFPLSDKASDVTKTLERECKNCGAEIYLNARVLSVKKGDNGFETETTQKTFLSDSVIIATGGLSYPLTGSTGDGYGFAKDFAHTVVPAKPALVGIELKGDFYKKIQGLSLKNVSLSAKIGEKTVFSEMGEMLFTHYGISGPIALSCSSVINKFSCGEVKLCLDLKPALSDEVLDKRLVRELQTNGLKTAGNMMRSLMPSSLSPVILNFAKIKESARCSDITAAERKRLKTAIKNVEFAVKSLRPIEEAIITSGGVSVKEINPKTMESKLVKNLYFAGEVIDVDAFTGGYNLQTAFSTAYLAGKNA